MNKTVAVFAVLSLMPTLSARAQSGTTSPDATFEVLAHFDGTVASQPLGGLVKGPDGTLYGTTHRSSNTMCGTVYKVTPGGDTVVLHEFQGAFAVRPDGCNPVGSLAIGADGNLYGTTWQGGQNKDQFASTGTGTIFRVSLPSELVSVVHSFAAFDSVNTYYPEGILPFAGLTLGNDNALWGTTGFGGTWTGGSTSGCGGGTVYRFFTDGTDRLEVMHSLVPDVDGCAPNGGLYLSAEGDFYGLASGGGTAGLGGNGTIFRITHAGTFTKLFVFPKDLSCDCWPLGANPVGEPIRDADGNLYGVAVNYGPPAIGQESGTIWRLSPSGQLTVLQAFTHNNGAFPRAGLTFGTDGALYGTTYSGGAHMNGTAFRISTEGEWSVLHEFEQLDGFAPWGRLTETEPGVFAGTTSGGGSSLHAGGVVFRLTLDLTGNDTTPPSLSLPSTVIVNATSPVGATVVYDVLASDDTDLSPTVNCVPPSGSIFTIGTTIVICTATDASNNSSNGTFIVSVKGPAAQIADLQAVVQNISINNGSKKKLQGHLDAAQGALASGDNAGACTNLAKFIAEVNGKNNERTLTEAQRQQLTGGALRVRAVLACS